VNEAGIALQWLARLRWLAVAGQTLAALIAVFVLRLQLPLAAMELIIAVTALSNLALQFVIGPRAGRMSLSLSPALVPGVLVLDVLLLTALLLCSGGAGNPFSILYLVHIAMAVATLPEAWSWMVAATATACYALLFLWPLEFRGPLQLTPVAAAAANWVAVTLVAIVIAYFVGRMNRSLRRHQRELIDARERAGRNERLAALTTLAAGAAHELNTPLSTIAVVARELELLGEKLSLPAAESAGGAAGFVQDARLIRQEVNRCQFILSRMRLDALHGESPGEESPAAMDELLKELQADFNSGETTLRVKCEGELSMTPIPARTLRQALAILIDNAMDASPPGKAVDLAIVARNGDIVFEVSDGGAGMSDDVCRRAGEPFFTTKPPGVGMGLGLFLARLLAEKLGGSLVLRSTPGLGTRATLQMPREPGHRDRRTSHE